MKTTKKILALVLLLGIFCYFMGCSISSCSSAYPNMPTDDIGELEEQTLGDIRQWYRHKINSSYYPVYSAMTCILYILAMLCSIVALFAFNLWLLVMILNVASKQKNGKALRLVFVLLITIFLITLALSFFFWNLVSIGICLIAIVVSNIVCFFVAVLGE